MKTNRLIVILLLLFSTGCSVTVRDGSGTTPTPFLVTQTLPPSATAAPTYTPLPPPSTPTAVPVEGTASTQVNVRAQPSTTGEVLGIVAANARVQIIGRDPGGNWWQILYPAGVDGKGWVTAQYVTTAGKPEVPVVGGGEAGSPPGTIAVIQQKINIRSGPGTGFNSIGTLNPQDAVPLTGRDSSGAWLQIEFAAGPGGRGWINAAFTQATGAENLPIITETGLVVGTGTPTGVPPTPTVTVLPARDDGDSAQNPAVSVSLSATGTRSFQYSGDLSAPDGDAEDWISFRTTSKKVSVRLECKEDGSVKAELFEGTQTTGILLTCEESASMIDAKQDSTYRVHLQAESSSSGVQYSTYTITIKVNP